MPTQRLSKLILCIIVSFATSPGLLAQESTRVTAYSAVRFSYDDLSGIVMKIQRFVQKANENEHCEFIADDLTVDDGEFSLKLQGDYSRAAFNGAPQTAYSVLYWYKGCTRAPISSVWLWLEDGIRRLTVTGQSSDQVQALTTLVTEDLNQFGWPYFGGDRFRVYSSLVLGIIAASLITLIPFLLNSRVRSSTSIGFGLTILVSLFICPWRKWFPGTAVYSGSASFLVRNEPLISFGGLLATIVTFIVAMWWTSRSASPATPTPPHRKRRSSQTRATPPKDRGKTE